MPSNLGEQTWVPRASGNNYLTRLRRNRCRCRSHNRKIERRRTKSNGTDEIGFQHNFCKSKHSFFGQKHMCSLVVASSLMCWTVLKNSTFRTFLASAVHGGPQTSGRPHSSQTVTILKAKQVFIETQGRQVSPSLKCRFTISTYSRDIALGQHIQDWTKCLKIFAVWRDGAACTPNAWE